VNRLKAGLQGNDCIARYGRNDMHCILTGLSGGLLVKSSIGGEAVSAQVSFVT